MLDIALRVAAGLFGITLVINTILSAVRTIVLPRSAADKLTRLLFRTNRRIFNLWAKPARSYDERDRAMALYAPISLVMLPGLWLTLVMIGFAGIYWMLGVEPLRTALQLSITSVSALGFTTSDNVWIELIMFVETTISIVLAALLISYLPAIYAAFSKRESLVTMLEVRAGAPPTVSDMLIRYHLLNRLEILSTMWQVWEQWFAELEESHTSLAVLAFFRSPRPHRSWVTAAGAVLDSASFVVSTVDIPHDPQADICIRSGYIALRHIADFFNITYDHDPKQGDPISITREEYEDVCRGLEKEGIKLKPDRDQTWLDFAGWRVNYDTVLLTLAGLTMAPYAPWVSDRSAVTPQTRAHAHRRPSLARLFRYAETPQQAEADK